MGATPDPDALSGVAPFRNLAPERLSEPGAFLLMTVFPAGAGAIASEEPGKGAYVVLKENVEAHALRPDGTDVILTGRSTAARGSLASRASGRSTPSTRGAPHFPASTSPRQPRPS